MRALSLRPADATSERAPPDMIWIILVAGAECQCHYFCGVMPGGPDKTLDCVGLFCPMPILKTREAMLSMGIGQILEMLSDDPASEADVKSWTGRTGHELISMDKHGAVFRFVLRKTR